jgi:hypothetical protein
MSRGAFLELLAKVNPTTQNVPSEVPDLRATHLRLRDVLVLVDEETEVFKFDPGENPVSIFKVMGCSFGNGRKFV